MEAKSQLRGYTAGNHRTTTWPKRVARKASPEGYSTCQARRNKNRPVLAGAEGLENKPVAFDNHRTNTPPDINLTVRAGFNRPYITSPQLFCLSSFRTASAYNVAIGRGAYNAHVELELLD